MLTALWGEPEYIFLKHLWQFQKLKNLEWPNLLVKICD